MVHLLDATLEALLLNDGNREDLGGPCLGRILGSFDGIVDLGEKKRIMYWIKIVSQ